MPLKEKAPDPRNPYRLCGPSLARAEHSSKHWTLGRSFPPQVHSSAHAEPAHSSKDKKTITRLRKGMRTRPANRDRGVSPQQGRPKDPQQSREMTGWDSCYPRLFTTSGHVAPGTKFQDIPLIDGSALPRAFGRFDEV